MLGRRLGLLQQSNDLVGGTSVTLVSDSIRAERVGPATRVECLPPEWAPAVDAV